MDKGLQEKLMMNFNEKNLESVDKLIEESMPEQPFRMVVNESGNGEEPKITEESRKKCVKSLLR